MNIYFVISKTRNQRAENDAFNVSAERPAWVRVKSGAILGGVSRGLALQWNINPWILRAFFLTASLFFGLGLALYLILLMCLPQGSPTAYQEGPLFLGVCLYFSKRSKTPVGLMRLLFTLTTLLSYGLGILLYLYFYRRVSRLNSNQI